MRWLVDLPLPYLSLVLGSVAVFALAITTIVIVLVEGWSDHRHDTRTLAEIPDPDPWLPLQRRRYNADVERRWDR